MESISKKKIRVLISEDVEADALLMVRQLRRSGFDPDWQRVQSAEEFAAKLDSSLDIILADYRLPQFSALEALRILKKSQLDIPIFVVTGSLGDELAVECIREGAADYMLKDRMARLGQAVNRALEEKQLRAERKQAEAARSAAEAKFKRLVEQSLVGIYMIQDDRFVYVNPKMAEIFGFSQEEMTSAPVVDFIHEDDRAMVRENIAKRIAGEITSMHYSLRGVRKDGVVVYLEAHGGVTEYNNRTAILGTLLDVTGRKRSEMRLAAFSDLMQKLAAAQTPKEAGEIIVQKADDLFGWNCCTLDLYSPEKNRVYPVLNKDILNGKRVDCLPAYADTEPSPLARKVINEGAQLILKKNLLEVAPGAVPFGDTNRPCASLMFVPIRDGAKVIGILSVQSYTPNAFAPDDLNTLQALADHCGGALNRIQAEEQHRKLEVQFRQAQKMEAIGQLAGGVAHDFNNLLTVITGYSEFLVMDDNLDPFIAEQMKEISTAAKRAGSLTRQLLAFSRKQDIKLKPVNLNDVISDLTKMLTRIIGEDVRLENRFAPGLPFVDADIGMMEQILLNLSVNARDAMPEGGELLVSTEAVTIDLDHQEKNPDSRAGEFVCLAVTDTGTGMPPETLARIFEPFFTTKAVGKGTGLGLATVYGIMKQHQGWIEVESQPGAGTTFKLFFPPSTQPAPVSEPATERPKIRGGTETILLVEDEVAVRSLARRILRDLGYTILEAESGVAGLTVWNEHADEVDLLLTDLVMPDGLTGRELAEKLKQLRPDLKIIYSSGYSHSIAGGEMELREGINFLPKPYDPRKLAEMVRKCLDSNGGDTSFSHNNP